MTTALIIILVIVVLLVLWLAGTYNGFVKLRNKTEEAFSAMDVSLKKRYDLIPNFVETVKGYAKHESETLEKVIAARNMAMTSRTPEETIKNDNVLTGTLKSLFALSEGYPDLKANQNFLQLQEQLSRVEEEIAGSRRYYNGVVNKYNTKTEMFPGNLLAGIFGFRRKPLYEVNEAAERESVKVSF
ncbi:LemA family protein [Ruminococcus sp. OA3]|uniref:LemA family protein n=1 Tax=Ruminococcus sp. OA3 TaxID=2914164 RepID=UPI001F06A85A|nr:LemA family protein [Ruminococcus sp. OA3]MCH1983962.1 LemA family protein [Ruminococcus sp. OA3]